MKFTLITRICANSNCFSFPFRVRVSGVPVPVGNPGGYHGICKIVKVSLIVPRMLRPDSVPGEDLDLYTKNKAMLSLKRGSYLVLSTERIKVSLPLIKKDWIENLTLRTSALCNNQSLKALDYCWGSVDHFYWMKFCTDYIIFMLGY